MEELYEKIEAYLAGTMTADAIQQFEKELQGNPDLAAELALHRKMQQTFADPQEVALRNSLQEIRTNLDQTAPTSNKKPFYQRTWFYVTLIAALFVIYLLSRNQNTVSVLPEESRQDSVEQQAPGTSSTLPTVDSSRLEVPETIEENTQPPPTRPPVATRDPFASNPIMEALLDPEVRSFRYDFELNANLVELDAGTNLIIDGILISTKLAEEQFVIEIFDNRRQSYPASPLLSQALTPREINENQPQAFGGKLNYAILLDEMIADLEPGLYYYQIRLKGADTPLYTGTFRKEKE
jgi:hypothetical protein